MDSVYDMWPLTTFTGYAGEQLWVSSFAHGQLIEMKLTFRAGTLELPEVRWLVDNFFDSTLARKTLRSAAGNGAQGTAIDPRPSTARPR